MRYIRKPIIAKDAGNDSPSKEEKIFASISILGFPYLFRDYCYDLMRNFPSLKH